MKWLFISLLLAIFTTAKNDFQRAAPIYDMGGSQNAFSSVLLDNHAGTHTTFVVAPFGPYVDDAVGAIQSSRESCLSVLLSARGAPSPKDNDCCGCNDQRDYQFSFHSDSLAIKFGGLPSGPPTILFCYRVMMRKKRCGSAETSDQSKPARKSVAAMVPRGDQSSGRRVRDDSTW